MEAIVLAGGKSTRLASRLNNIPKPMVPIAGRPFLEWLLEALAAQGCDQVYLSVGHLYATIQDHFQNSFAGLGIQYVVEESPLGTGGAIRSALAAIRSDSAFVLNGDTYVLIDYRKMRDEHLHRGRPLSMSVVHQNDTGRYGQVVLDRDSVSSFREKGTRGPGWINAGVYLIRKDIDWPEQLAACFSFENDFLAPEIARLHPWCHQCQGYFIDIGVPEDLDRAKSDFANGGILPSRYDSA
ncbi:MAG: nucleotidyltransferase family protein [Terracidiphilus sp.]|jgi:D-glycero-alpha-D-manno-heptose 1-phosphate guanylyltransferase